MKVFVRPAVASDMGLIQTLVRGLSPRTRYLRFFSGARELSQAWLERFTRADPRGGFTLLALLGETPAGMAQCAAASHPQRCELAVVVADAWQGVGIGGELLRKTLCAAREAGFQRAEAEVLAENKPMLRLLRRLGFELRRDPRGALSSRASLAL